MTPPISPTPAVPAPSEKELREPHPSIAHVRQLFPEDAYVAWKKEHKHHTDCPYGDVKLCAFMSGIGYAVDHLKPPAPSVDVKQEHKSYCPRCGCADHVSWSNGANNLAFEGIEHTCAGCGTFETYRRLLNPDEEPKADVSADVKAELNPSDYDLPIGRGWCGYCTDQNRDYDCPTHGDNPRTWTPPLDAIRRHAGNSPAVRVEAEPEDLEPAGGNFYNPHPILINSGTFWRCKHGNTGLKSLSEVIGCEECAKENPEGFNRFHGKEPDVTAVPAPRQNELIEILDRMEQREGVARDTKGKEACDCFEELLASVADVPKLVKALRKAISSLIILEAWNPIIDITQLLREPTEGKS